MATADSTIRVNIIGDAKKLATAADSAQGSVKGLSSGVKKLGAALAGLALVDTAFDFGQSALNEADRVGDATGRIEDHLGDLSATLTDTADDFAFIGASEGDMLDLEAAILDVGTALGIAKDELAPLSIDAAKTASALALITDTDADTWMGTLGKAAGGSEKALRALGVSVSDTDVVARALADSGKSSADALTEGELAAARLALILEQLAPRISDVTDGNADLEQKQAEVQAKFETLTGKIGEALEGPLSDLLDFILSGIEGWELLGDKLNAAGVSFESVTGFVKDLLSPLARAIDLTNALIDALTHLDRIWGGAPGDPSFGNVPAGARGGSRFSGGNSTTTINVQGGSPEAIEQAVRNAVGTTARRG